MKTSVIGNLVNLKTVGIDRRKLDVWLSPKIIDFKRKFEVRINDRRATKEGSSSPSTRSWKTCGCAATASRRTG